MALGIEGLRIGTWTHPDVPTGCTVLLPPDGALGAIAVRGASPGTREAASLGPHGKVQVCHGVVLSGGSAFGLATADGVVRWLEEQGIGYPIGDGFARVPIVGAAIVLDLAVAFPDARPDAAAGRAACEAATEDDPPEGAVGAGAGATVAKVGGLEHGWRGGQGIATARHRDVVVSAIVVNNAVGEIVGPDGATTLASRAPADVERFPYSDEVFHGRGRSDGGDGADGAPGGPTTNTVIGCIVTNARLTKAEAYRVADLGHTGTARAVQPAHTQSDGDALFCLSTQQVDAPLDLVTTLAADAVAEAARRGPAAAVSRGPLALPDGTELPGVPGAAG